MCDELRSNERIQCEKIAAEKQKKNNKRTQENTR